MRRHGFLLTALAACAMLVSLAPLARANGDSIYPFPNINRTSLVQYELFQMRQGWSGNQLVWFICTDTSDVKTAFDEFSNQTIFWQGLTLAPKLIAAAPDVAVMYVILNYQQGPVFPVVPGDGDYSGVWSVVFVRYHSDVTPRAVSNTDLYDADTNPTGLPPASDADYLTTNSNGVPVVVKCPIMAVGKLGGPWYPGSDGTYRIPQGRADFNYTYTKQIWLPFWYVYCQNFGAGPVFVRRVIVPDVWDPPSVPDPDKIGLRIGANVAPGLAAISITAEQNFYFFNGPKPLSQLPVVRDCPTDWYFPWLNRNPNYSPVMVYVALDRFMPASSVINNTRTIDLLLGNGKLSVARDDQVINAPIIPELPLP